MRCTPVWRAVLWVLAVSALLGGCSLSGDSDGTPLANAPGEQVQSPHGYVASLLSGTNSAGEPEYVRVRITSAQGAEVFLDSEGYSLRHGVAAVWQKSRDVLWVLSADVGDSTVSVVNGRWTKSPGTHPPPEIEALK